MKLRHLFPINIISTIAFMLIAPFVLSSEKIFTESFDELPDWTSDAIYNTTSKLDNFEVPERWYAGTSRPLWSPATGYPDNHPVAEILKKNSYMARGGTGKSFVSWRESYNPGWKKFNSDNVLLKYFSKGYNEIYTEFWITFSNEMIETYYKKSLGQSKIFRVYYFNGDETAIFSYFGGNNKPGFSWDVSGGGSTGYGVRNFHAYLVRGESDIRNIIKGLPGSMQGSGDTSLWYAASATKGQAIDGGSPTLVDYKNGGTITKGPVALDQVFGTQSQWVKVAFYVKMNSGPGIADGELMQWINDERILHATSIPWIREGSDMVKWNTIGIGGNDYFQAYPNERQYEEWYAIDDIVVRDAIPKRLLSTSGNPPQPPTDILLK
ncbi:MAG: hypothetical protein ACTHZ7_14760 [Sphingobacterium sp.]